MIKVAVLVIALFAVAYSQTIGPGRPDPRCPPGTPEPPLHFPNYIDCNRFYTCVNGLLTPRACPPGEIVVGEIVVKSIG